MDNADSYTDAGQFADEWASSRAYNYELPAGSLEVLGASQQGSFSPGEAGAMGYDQGAISDFWSSGSPQDVVACASRRVHDRVPTSAGAQKDRELPDRAARILFKLGFIAIPFKPLCRSR